MARKKQDVSIYKIAEEAGVSAATVSRVLNNRVGVSEKLRHKIQGLVQEYKFRANYTTPRRPRISIIKRDDDFTFYSREALFGIYRYCNDHGIVANLIIHTQNAEESILTQIRDMQCAGLIMMPQTTDMNYTEVLQADLPVVFLDDRVKNKKAGYIDNDSFSGACEAAEHLLELGHTRIGYLQSAGGAGNFIQRLNGYETTLKRAGIKIKKNWIVCTDQNTPLHPHGIAGITLMEQLLDQAPEVTAVMASDDYMAMGAMTAIHRRGLKIPQDISIVGFDNYPETACWYPALTTVNHPIKEAAFKACEALWQYIESTDEWKPPKIVMPAHLIVRESSGPVK